MYIRSIEIAHGQAPSSPIPVGAVAGGIAAGASLAVIVTLGWLRWKRGSRRRWICWGEAKAATKYETTQHRALSEPYSPSQGPCFPYPVERRLKFETRSNNPKSASTSTVSGLPGVSKPRPLRSAKNSSHLPLGAKDRYFGTSMLSPPKIAHKPSSTVSSVSMYSTESGEEHQVRVPPNLILAATGGLNVGHDGDRRSVTPSSRGFPL
ncbi:hypothetical protein E4T56_gene11014 [Termitomyces sp. T112]|nr:hypothetical protein E4T56_gene11014 [Termitomyces sp. T112]KAH0584175.1 hypothetical protein H2248_009731 [Termitomyces sp. 'cryptogamus']